MKKKSPYFQLLQKIVLRPSPYYWVIGLPGRFDAAEYLYQHHWNDVTEQVARKIEEVLLRSGRYINAL
jgi:hypothetical protein